MPDNAIQEIAHMFKHRLQWRYILVIQASIAVFALSLVLYTSARTSEGWDKSEHLQHAKRNWGGWDERPQTQQCYIQERTATLLALYLGVFGADHWYARHWLLAAFKLFTLGGFGIWAVADVTLWIIGGVYGTPGCPGASKNGWTR